MDILRRTLGRDQPEAPRPPSPWLSDAPTDLDKELDAFGVEPIVTELVRLVGSAAPPFTLSLSGAWGSGKSTIAEALVTRLQTTGKPAVLIDAWTEDVDELRRTIVVAVAAAMRQPKNLTKQLAERERIAKEIDEETRYSRGRTEPETKWGVWKAIRHHPLGVGLVVLVIAALILTMVSLDPNSALARGLPPVLGVLVGFLLVGSGYLFVVHTTTVTKGPAEASTILAREFRKAVTGADGTKAGSVLAVVDNLDRLPGDDAVRALAEIRALVEIKGSRCVFLVPVDRGALVGHIKGSLDARAQAPSDSGKAVQAANDYLDKFFNLDLTLSQPQPTDIRKWALEQAARILQPTHDADLAEAVQVIAYAAGATTVVAGGSSPRAVKRILNGVSTRQRMTQQAGANISLGALAVVECIVSRYPSLLSWASKDPRRFLQLRADLIGGVTPTETIKNARVSIDGADIEPLTEFLTTFQDIEFDAGDLAVMLSLRADREWPGVSAPTDVRLATRQGDPATFAVALDETPEGEREAVFSAVARWIEDSSGTFHRDALAALTAIAPSVDGSSSAGRIRRVGGAAMAKADAATIARLTPDVVSLLSGGSDRDMRKVAAKYLDGFQTVAGEATDEQVRVLQLLAGHLDSQARDKAKTLLAQSPFEAQRPLFEPALDVGLVSGPVASNYYETIASMPADIAAIGGVTPTADRMVAFRDAGGLGPTDPAPMATQLAKLVSATPSPYPATLFDFVDRVVRMLDGGIGTEIDQLGTLLASRTSEDRGRLMAAALRLDVSSVSATVQQFDAWTNSPTVDATEVEIVLREHTELFATQNSEWVLRLVDQWRSRSKVAFAELAMRYGGENGSNRLIKVALRDDDAGPALADVLPMMTEPAKLADLILKMADWVRRVAPGYVRQAASSIARAAANGDVNPIVMAVRERGEASSTPTEIEDWVDVASELDVAGVPGARSLASPFVRRGAAVGLASAASARWLARSLVKEHPVELATVVARAIDDTSLPMDQAIALAAETRVAADRKATVAFSLIKRTAGSVQDRDLADAAVREALNWRPQPGDFQREYQERADEIAGRYSDLNDLVIELKNKGRRS